MYYLVTLILDDIARELEVFDAWENTGVGGITILESTGLARIRLKEGYRDDIPLMPSIRSFFHSREEHHRTIFSIVQGEAMVQRLIDVTESLLGPLSTPHTGIMFAVPISHVAGVPRKGQVE
ncbi:MAG: hypothetical protein KA586_01560 [Candidatus Promineofilum sp.]|nr:hypothetical protein [Promineifilum sp.]